MRVCSRCRAEKPLADFPIKNAAKGWYGSYCRSCCREYGKEHYRKNVAAYVSRSKAQAAIDRPINREFVATYLSTHVCVDCGESDPVVLEFDHRDPGTKRADVGQLIHSSTVAVVRAEIGKCDVRCGNCHRIRTAAQFGSYRLGEPTGAYRF
ncbi:MAG TPA: hypothetical protein VIN69_04480 [Candidatus Limnocylindria bacterium]|jgi:hypothetical protein